jgi:hypothetical protein
MQEWVFCWLQQWGEEKSIVREWGFLLVARVGRERGRWESVDGKILSTYP